MSMYLILFTGFDGILAVNFIISLDFAVTRSSPESCCNIFAMASEQTVEL